MYKILRIEVHEDCEVLSAFRGAQKNAIAVFWLLDISVKTQERMPDIMHRTPPQAIPATIAY